MRGFVALALVGLMGLGAFLIGGRQESAALTEREGLTLVRTINTAEVTYLMKTKSGFVSLDKLLASSLLGGKGQPGYPNFGAEIQLADETSGTIRDYKLSVIASADGKHYSVDLAPQKGCATAFFSNDAAIIFPAKALGCEGK